MTQRKVRVGKEGAGHLWPTPLPVSTVKLNITEILANLQSVILTWERDLVDDLIRAKLTLRHPEILTLGGESRKEEENVNSHDDGDHLVNM